MMEGRYLLWLYLFSAGWTACLWARKRDLFHFRYLPAVLGTAAASAAGLAWPRAYPVAFPAATAGFLLFFLLPGLLVRLARGAARRRRFGAAAGILALVRVLLPARFLASEQEVYRRAASDLDAPGIEALHRWLRSAPDEAGGPRALPATWVLVGTFLLLYLACILMGGFSGPSRLLTLLSLGANDFRRVADGEWFRLSTAMFLHVGALHLAMNVIAVLVVGRWVEPGLGPARTFVLFLLGGLLGNLVSIFFYGGGAEPYVSAGASGGAMSLIGASLVVALRAPASPLRARQVQSLVVIIGATIFLGFVEEGIDNGAHLGGLAAGAVLALVLTGRRALPDRVVRPVASILVAAALASFAWMLTTLPSWHETREFRGPNFRFAGPAFLVETKDGYDGGVVGSVEVAVRHAPGGAERLLQDEIRPRLEAEALEDDRERHPVGTVVSRVTAGRWIGAVFDACPHGTHPPMAVYVLPAPDPTRAAVLRIRPGDDDPALLDLLGRSVLDTFEFR